MRLLIVAAFVLLLRAEPASAKQTSYFNSAPSTVPAFPIAGGNHNTSAACELDLSAEMFGGVEEACGRGVKIDRSRCCPVLAAWLFAAHARSALRFHPSASPGPVGQDPSPMMPETDSKRCADALQTALHARNISLPRPNTTCDAALCFCGIHLHEISSLSCSAAFNLSTSGEGGGDVSPIGDVRELERDCRNASYAGCTRCLNSLQKLKGGSGVGGGGERAARMMDRDCRLMGLTWLLGRNKTAYIPTVSAVLRAILYSAHPPTPPHGCSADQENMPLAVDSNQVQRAAAGSFSSVSRSAPWIFLYSILALSTTVQVAL
ncbi:hypothetical protein IEQ34_016936 [Dendrobium chrysotoxum]|uniref:SPARK domain-containing protein n=1 Tax=Dendrobium chrysotoxum TaxID=161865 RepID=A0AAV7GHS2_DENCH|nr:hypothetical protein IEQ34_016936 [Dendrobium chrysotoxum]